MGIRVIYVMTHDSIGLGEDGPTHQPVEHLAALRAIPNLLVFRPADAMETAECWQLALESGTIAQHPGADPPEPAGRCASSMRRKTCARRAPMKSAPPAGEAQVTIFATGSEVEIAVAAQALLQKARHSRPRRLGALLRTVRRQPEKYRKAVIGSASGARRGRSRRPPGLGTFHRQDGIFVGMNGFGASGPYEELYEHFGITPDAIVQGSAGPKLKKLA